MTTKAIEEWMRENRVKRIVRVEGGFASFVVYTSDDRQMGTGVSIDEALQDARRFA